MTAMSGAMRLALDSLSRPPAACSSSDAAEGRRHLGCLCSGCRSKKKTLRGHVLIKLQHRSKQLRQLSLTRKS